MSDITERLRARAFRLATQDMNGNGARLAIEAADEIDRLRTELKGANDLAERFERGWYLRGDALEKLQAWADAYPLTIFPEPDFKRAHEVLTANGMTLDAISASNMRHVINGVRKLVDEGLKA